MCRLLSTAKMGAPSMTPTKYRAATRPSSNSDRSKVVDRPSVPSSVADPLTPFDATTPLSRKNSRLRAHRKANRRRGDAQRSRAGWVRQPTPQSRRRILLRSLLPPANSSAESRPLGALILLNPYASLCCQRLALFHQQERGDRLSATATLASGLCVQITSHHNQRNDERARHMRLGEAVQLTAAKEKPFVHLQKDSSHCCTLVHTQLSVCPVLASEALPVN